MKNKINLILKILNILIIVLAIGVLAYFLGYKRLEIKIYQKAVSDIVGTIVNQIEKTGEIKINNLILIKKPNEQPKP